MKAYSLYAVLFLASMLLFFVGAFTGNVAMALAGFLLTFALYLFRRFFARFMQER